MFPGKTKKLEIPKSPALRLFLSILRKFCPIFIAILLVFCTKKYKQRKLWINSKGQGIKQRCQILMDLISKIFVSKQWKKQVWLYNYENIFSFIENMLCAFNFNSDVRNTVQPLVMATSLQQSLFLVDSPYTDSCLTPCTTFTFCLSPRWRCEGVQLYCCKC